VILVTFGNSRFTW